MPIKDKEYHRIWQRKKMSKLTPEQRVEHLKRKAELRKIRVLNGGKDNEYNKTPEARLRKMVTGYKKRYGEFWEAQLMYKALRQEMNRNPLYESVGLIRAEKNRSRNVGETRFRGTEEHAVGNDAAGEQKDPKSGASQRGRTAGQGDFIRRKGGERGPVIKGPDLRSAQEDSFTPKETLATMTGGEDAALETVRESDQDRDASDGRGSHPDTVPRRKGGL